MTDHPAPLRLFGTQVTHSYVTKQIKQIPLNRRFRLLSDDPEATIVTYILALPVVVLNNNEEESRAMQERLQSRFGEHESLLYAVKQGVMKPWPDTSTLVLIKESNQAVYHLSNVYHSGLALTNSKQRRALATTKIAIGELRATGQIAARSQKEN